MGRSGYSEDWDGDEWEYHLYAGTLANATRGKRGQQFFKDLLAALDAMPEKRLIANDLVRDGEVCAIGALGRARGVDMAGVDPEDAKTVSGLFNIAECLARTVVFENDDHFAFRTETPEQRFDRMRRWVASQIVETPRP